jgi:hypothetical protein
VGDTLTAVGTTGQIEVDGEFVTIRRKGLRSFINQGVKGDKRIPLTSVVAVQFKKAGLTDGYLQLTIPGGVESRGGWAQSGSDENTVTFNRRQQPAFEALRDQLEERLVERSRSAGMGAASPVTPPADIPEQIRKLAALRDDGVLTDEEFAAKKAELLAKM